MLGGLQKSVRAKLLVLMFTTTLVALMVALFALAIYDARNYSERWVSDLSTQAEILGRSSAAAIAFDDPDTARENLRLLQVRPLILSAALYDPAGRLFASYTRDQARPAPFPSAPAADGVQVNGDEIVISRRIVESGDHLGTVYIRAKYELVERLLDYLGILGTVLILSMLAALLIWAWLQKAITKPLKDITVVARQVMESRNFSLRVQKTTDDEIGYLVDAFNNMLAEIGRGANALLAADRMKDQFIATLAHELRNPLAPISNALHLLEMAGDESEVAANARQMMARQLKQLVRLVDDLLDVSRITTGKLVLKKDVIELHRVIDNAVEIARPLIQSRGHHFSVELPPEPVYLDGDETRLAQVFSNLLNNAAKYTEPHGNIALRAEISDGTVSVSVIDSGMGIPPENLKDIFEMFTQASTSPDRTQAGLGVGLALALRLIEMHGGSIQASSAGVGLGSRFTVTLPLTHRGRHPQPPAAQPAASRNDTHRVLVVDDNHDFATSLAAILRSKGHEVHVEHNGVDGLRAAAEFRPELAFLDIGLPGMSGYELARELRAQPLHQDLFLVAITGWGQASDKLRANQAGFDHHIVKPLDPSQLPAIFEIAARKRVTQGS